VNFNRNDVILIIGQLICLTKNAKKLHLIVNSSVTWFMMARKTYNLSTNDSKSLKMTPFFALIQLLSKDPELNSWIYTLKNWLDTLNYFLKTMKCITKRAFSSQNKFLLDYMIICSWSHSEIYVINNKSNLF